MKSLKYLRVFQLQWDMHKVKVIKSYTGLFNEYVKRSLSSVAFPHAAFVMTGLPLKNIHWFDWRLVIEG